MAAAAAWEVPVGIVLFIFSGIALAVQAGVNASLGIHTSKAFAGVCLAWGPLVLVLLRCADVCSCRSCAS
jgi:uncharacterized membrane protein YdcZ (DUF606 family)